MFVVGDRVRVLAPFEHSFPNVYTVVDVVHNGDGTTVYILSDDAGGFDAAYLESA